MIPAFLQTIAKLNKKDNDNNSNRVNYEIKANNMQQKPKPTAYTQSICLSLLCISRYIYTIYIYI